MITIRGKEFNFNVMNADHIQQWEDARKTVQEKYNDIAEANPQEIGLQEYANLIRRACNAIFDLFDGILGEGTANELMGKECDFEVCIDAFGEFETAVQEQADKFGKKISGKVIPFGKKGK